MHGPWRDPGGYNFPESEIFFDLRYLASFIARHQTKSRDDFCSSVSSNNFYF